MKHLCESNNVIDAFNSVIDQQLCSAAVVHKLRVIGDKQAAATVASKVVASPVFRKNLADKMMSSFIIPAHVRHSAATAVDISLVLSDQQAAFKKMTKDGVFKCWAEASVELDKFIRDSKNRHYLTRATTN